ncbi:MAG: glycerol-3-phosphate acyltransferase, partial [Gemmiger sp.]
MWHTEEIVQRGICLLLGYGFGGILTGELVARAVTGQSARLIGNGNPGMANIMEHLGKGAGFVVLLGDILKTAAACWACWVAASPRLGLVSILYGGFGTVLGHDFPFWSKGWGGKGVAVTCTWLILGLPFTGILCCLAGGAVVLGLGYLPLGAVIIPALAIPAAWIQLG